MLRHFSLMLFCSFTIATTYGQTTQPIRSFATGATPEKELLAPLVSADGSKIAIRLSQTNVGWFESVYDVATGKKLFETPPPNNDTSDVVAFSPDGARMVLVTTRNQGQTLQLIDLATGRILFAPPPFDYNIALISPDGKKLIYKQKRPEFDPEYQLEHFTIVDLDSFTPSGEFKTGPTDFPINVFSPDGKLIVTQGGSSQMLMIYDITQSKLISSLEMPANRRESAIQFTPDAKQIRGVDESMIITVWDVASGKVLSRVEPHELISNVNNIAFSSDGKTLLFGRNAQIQFRDATSNKIIGVWPYPTPRSAAYLSTLRGNRIFIANDQTGELSLYELPPAGNPMPPKISSTTNAHRNQPPATSPATAVPPHNEQDLHSPLWWIDRAEAEWTVSKDRNLKLQTATALITARAAAHDFGGAERMERAVAALSPTTRAQSKVDPLAGARFAIAGYQVTQLVHDGNIQEAQLVAQQSGDNDSTRNLLMKTLAIAQARSGDIDGAIQTISTLSKDFQAGAAYDAARYLLLDAHPDLAEKSAMQIADAYVRGKAFEKIGVYYAKHDDLPGAITNFAKGPANRMGGDAAAEIVAAFANRNEDEKAGQFLATLQPDQQNLELARLAQAQLDRDDLDAAIHTSAQLDSNDKYDFARLLAVAQVRVGQTQQVINAISIPKHNSQIDSDAFNAMLKYGRLDAAIELLGHLPPPEDPREDAKVIYGRFAKPLAKSLADAGRIADAQRVLSSTSPEVKADGRPDRQFQIAQWSIAAAQRRAGNIGAYNAILQPLRDAVNNATGAPSRANAQTDLVEFYMSVQDFDAVRATINELDPQLRPAAAMTLAFQSTAASLDLSQRREIARFITTISNSPFDKAFPATLAKAHLEQNKQQQWIDFVQSFPSAASRIAMYQAMASAMLPQEQIDPKD